MLFKKHPKAGMKAIDKMATGIILGGLMASVYGMKKYEEKKQEEIQKKQQGKLSKFFARLFHK